MGSAEEAGIEGRGFVGTLGNPALLGRNCEREGNEGSWMCMERSGLAVRLLSTLLGLRSLSRVEVRGGASSSCVASGGDSDS